MAKKDGGFSEAEREAMKERAAELRAEKGGKKKADNLQALLDKVAELEGPDQEIAATVHTIVTEAAPDLAARTWYGMPAWERDGAVLVFVQPAGKFGTRYSTLGFNVNAALDDGDLWATGFAVTKVTPAVRKKMVELITKATG